MDIAAANAALGCLFGLTATPPATYEVALYNGDPLTTGVELDLTGGYAPVAVANNATNFPAAANRAVTGALVDFGTSTGAWSDTATWLVIRDAVGGTGIWYSRPLSAEIVVAAAGVVVPPIRPVLTMNQEDDAA